MAKCLWYLEKAHRNAIRRHLKAGERGLALREAEAEQANAYVSVALREGWATADLVRCLYRTGNEARPYRPQDVHCAAAAFLKALSQGQPPVFRFEAFASELQMDETERLDAAEQIGIRLLGQARLTNSNDAVKDALASRRDVRRILRRHPR
jgi:hypothetical protein